MDDGFEERAVAWEKALADEANKQERTAAQEKVWADELRQMAARENALADNTDELRQAAALDKTLADKATEQRRADTLKKALANKAYKQRRAATRQKVLADEVNKRCCRPSTTVNGKPQKACCRSRPRLRVGRRHGHQASNTQEYLLCGLQHWPRAPNQSTVNEWA